MKTYIIAILVLILGSSRVLALTDVTGKYLVNAGLTSLDGWDYGDDGYTYTDWKTDGSVPVIEFYHTWSDNPGAAIGNSRNFHLSQTVTLPAGHYRLVVNAFYREGDGTGQNNKAYIFAGDQQQYVVGLWGGALNNYSGSNDLYRAADAFSKDDFLNELDFTLSQSQQITIGLRGYIDTYCSWCIFGPMKLYEYADDDHFEEDRQQLLSTLERFEREYNLTDGTDYGHQTMSAGAWSDLIAAVNAANLALDEKSQTPDYVTARDALVAQMDATDVSLRLFKSYQSMLAGTRAFGISAANTYGASSYSNTDAREQTAIEKLNTAFVNYATKQAADIDASAFLGDNLDFNTPQGGALVAMENVSIHDIAGWDEAYANLDGWCFIENSHADYNGQLYLRCNWTDSPVVLKVQKQRMLPVGKYRLSLSWNSNLSNMKNLSAYILGGKSKTISRNTSSAQTLNYEFEVADSPATFDLVFGFQKKNSGNAPAQILVDNIQLTRLYVVPSAIETVEQEKTGISENEIYDLSGRKLSNSQLPKGLYIINGRKVVVR